MFYLFSAMIIAYIMRRALSHDGGSGMRRGWMIVVLIAPTWMVYQLRSVRIDFRVLASIVGIAAIFMFRPKKPIVFKPMLSDLIIFLMFISICISQTIWGGMAPLTPFDIGAQWLASYCLGRVFLQHTDDIDDMIPVIAWMFAIVCCLDVFEAILHKNIVNTILGKTFGLLETGEGYRWGMKRSQGNVGHPIFNGFQLVMLFPWAAEASRRAKALNMGIFYRNVTWFAGTAAFFCISRGPQLALLITIGVSFFFRHPKLRLPMLFMAVTGVTLLVCGKEAVMHGLGKMAGESEEDVRIIYIEGEATEYTGTKHRVLLLQVYKDAIANAGYFGWGGAMKAVVLEESVAQRFGSIDSHYLMFYLQYGYVGVSLFITLMIVALYYSIQAAWNAKSSWCTLTGGLAGAFLAVALLMTSVWFAPDYGAVWLFNAGLVANIRSLPRQAAIPMDDMTKTSDVSPIDDAYHGDLTPASVNQVAIRGCQCFARNHDVSRSSTTRSLRRVIPVTQEYFASNTSFNAPDNVSS